MALRPRPLMSMASIPSSTSTRPMIWRGPNDCSERKTQGENLRIVGWKNSGKTTLMSQVIGAITARGFSVSAIKHTHHAVDLDQPGKDTYRHRASGAVQVALASSARWAVMTELRETRSQRWTIWSRNSIRSIWCWSKGSRNTGIRKWRRIATRPVKGCWPARTPPSPRWPPPIQRAPSWPDSSIPLLSLDDPAGVADYILKQVGLAE